jgi:hypothetical protein
MVMTPQAQESAQPSKTVIVIISSVNTMPAGGAINKMMLVEVSKIHNEKHWEPTLQEMLLDLSLSELVQ